MRRDVDGRIKSGHDELYGVRVLMTFSTPAESALSPSPPLPRKREREPVAQMERKCTINSAAEA
ncbi:hypothetical protein GCM10007301_10670 [Azorhizobium oxalatiphilum]|uniref:Uncharacterized protein n=1 Tax=Azorhizobium oxalatiphilum TaxID=980631 RepID=A0A917BQL1_9HYPH|nr:hypothetical protein GCM10007301_10670 [Azorhizobium oxalatiphilum]